MKAPIEKFPLQRAGISRFVCFFVSSFVTCGYVSAWYSLIRASGAFSSVPVIRMGLFSMIPPMNSTLGHSDAVWGLGMDGFDKGCFKARIDAGDPRDRTSTQDDEDYEEDEEYDGAGDEEEKEAVAKEAAHFIKKEEINAAVAEATDLSALSEAEIVQRGWALVHSGAKFSLFKRRSPTGAVIYLMMGSFADVSARTFLHSQIDRACREVWDGTMGEMCGGEIQARLLAPLGKPGKRRRKAGKGNTRQIEGDADAVTEQQHAPKSYVSESSSGESIVSGVGTSEGGGGVSDSGEMSAAVEAQESSKSEDVLYYRTKWPWPLKDRDYALARRCEVVGRGNAIVFISKSTEDAQYPPKEGVIRVDNYWCHSTFFATPSQDAIAATTAATAVSAVPSSAAVSTSYGNAVAPYIAGSPQQAEQRNAQERAEAKTKAEEAKEAHAQAVELARAHLERHRLRAHPLFQAMREAQQKLQLAPGVGSTSGSSLGGGDSDSGSGNPHHRVDVSIEPQVKVFPTPGGSGGAGGGGGEAKTPTPILADSVSSPPGSPSLTNGAEASAGPQAQATLSDLISCANSAISSLYRRQLYRRPASSDDLFRSLHQQYHPKHLIKASMLANSSLASRHHQQQRDLNNNSTRLSPSSSYSFSNILRKNPFFLHRTGSTDPWQTNPFPRFSRSARNAQRRAASFLGTRTGLGSGAAGRGKAGLDESGAWSSSDLQVDELASRIINGHPHSDCTGTSGDGGGSSSSTEGDETRDSAEGEGERDIRAGIIEPESVAEAPGGRLLIDLPGMKFVTIFCDDQQVPLPPKIVDILSKQGEKLVPGSVERLHALAADLEAKQQQQQLQPQDREQS